MALKVLMLKNKLDRAKAEYKKICSGDEGFKTREAELEQAIGEITDETSQEDRDTLEKLVDDFQTEKKDHDEKKGNLEREIEKIENEIKDEEKRSSTAADNMTKDTKERGMIEMNYTRTKFFGMNAQERDIFFAREDVKDFLQRTRELGGQKRAVTGAELLIPTVVLDLVKENVAEYSKLYKHVNVRAVSGKARQNVLGTIPEGVWTEMCATLNELSLKFSNVEVDGYKVGGYIAICNAVLEDSDINLANEIIMALGQAIGLALDKAILYGTGTKMPLGIVTRLAQSSKPDSYPASARPWANLTDTNLKVVSGKTDAALFKAIVEASGAAKSTYSTGAKFWAMNEATYTKLISNALTINATGAITAGVNNVMPVIGGAIEVLNFVPNDVIIGGYGDLYLLAERGGTTISQSEHAMFIQDQTVFKGTARYDGIPVIAEGFVAISLGGSAPTADAVTFTADAANSSAEPTEE